MHRLSNPSILSLIDPLFNSSILSLIEKVLATSQTVVSLNLLPTILKIQKYFRLTNFCKQQTTV